MSLQMLRVYLSDRAIGDGHRTVLVDDADLSKKVVPVFVPSLVASTTVDQDALKRAKAIKFRPLVVRRNLLERVAQHRRYGLAVPNKVVTRVLKELGAGETTIRSTINTDPLPDVVAKRQAEKAKAEYRMELADAQKAIVAKVDMAPEFEAIERSAAAIEHVKARGTNLDRLIERLEAGLTKDEILACMNWSGGCSKRIVKVAADAGRELLKEKRGAKTVYRHAPAQALSS